MPDDRWDTLQRLFRQALDLPADGRAAFLDESCRDTPGLREQVGDLLAAHDRASAFLESAHANEAETTLPDAPGPVTPGPLPTIPGYRIVREVGRGGMGIVYEAERLHPQQTIALKVLRPSFAQPSLRRRFEHEIHLLARLRHPGIAQIYDAGVAPSPLGPLPYFAMELVEGRPVDALARDATVSLRDRLALLAEIADAVQHAHQKAIIHRDLKPNNILVTPAGQPKILDFGVARALDPELQLTTMQTEIGQLVGTLPYMSPEQAAGDLDQLDTRSDVYSLGVVAFELLAGRPPYDLTAKLIPEAVRVIREEEPGRLSTIDRACRGDIETIVAKALEKQRERRYQSAAEFGADIRRFLSDEPIVARPPGRVYLVRKFARRHRSLVTSAAVAVVLLVAGAAVSTALALRLADSNDALTESVGDLRDARDEAQQQAETARAVNEFYTDHLLLAAAPEESLGRDITIEEALDSAASRVEADLAEHPEAAAFVHRALASVYRRLDKPELALHHAEASVQRYKAALGDEDPETFLSMNNLAALLDDGARFQEAEALRDEALEGLRRTAGDAHPYTLSVLRGQASRMMERGDHEGAVPLLAAVIEGIVALDEPDAPNLLDTRSRLAEAYGLGGRWEESERTLRDAIAEASASLPDDHPTMMRALNSLGAALIGREQFAEALPIVERVAAAAERVLGPEHVNTLIVRQNLAQTLSELDRLDTAEPIWLEMLPRLRARVPAPHPLLASVVQSYGVALAKHDRPADAVVQLTDAFEQYQATVGTKHPEAQRCVRWIVGMLEQTGDEPAAAAWRARLEP